MLKKQIQSGNPARRRLRQNPGSIHEINAVPGGPGGGGFDGLVDGGIGPKGQRIIVRRQFEVPPGLTIIGQGEFAGAHAKLQVGIFRINPGGFPIPGQRLAAGARGLPGGAVLV